MYGKFLVPIPDKLTQQDAQDHCKSLKIGGKPLKLFEPYSKDETNSVFHKANIITGTGNHRYWIGAHVSNGEVRYDSNDQKIDFLHDVNIHIDHDGSCITFDQNDWWNDDYCTNHQSNYYVCELVI